MIRNPKEFLRKETPARVVLGFQVSVLTNLQWSNFPPPQRLPVHPWQRQKAPVVGQIKEPSAVLQQNALHHPSRVAEELVPILGHPWCVLSPLLRGASHGGVLYGPMFGGKALCCASFWLAFEKFCV